jgi:hypothetical protein
VKTKQKLKMKRQKEMMEKKVKIVKKGKKVTMSQSLKLLKRQRSQYLTLKALSPQSRSKKSIKSKDLLSLRTPTLKRQTNSQLSQNSTPST